MSERRKRRRWTASEKLRIVLAGMESGVEVSELCRREGVNPTMYYGWKKKLLSSATKIFEEKAVVREYALRHPELRHRGLGEAIGAGHV